MEIVYNQGKKFKITVTANHELRIKIPLEYKDTEFEEQWINRCKVIADYLAEVEIENTMRGQNELYLSNEFRDTKLFTTHGHKGKDSRLKYIFGFMQHELVSCKKEE